MHVNDLELTKIKLLPDEVLSVTVKNDDISSDSMMDLHKMFKSVFPENKVLLLVVGTNGDVKYQVLGKGESNVDGNR